MTDTRRQWSGGFHALARATSTRRRLAPEDGYFFRCSFVSPCSDRVLFTVAAAMRSAVPSERPRSFSPSLMCSYCRSRFGDHEFCGMCHLRDSALHVACAARTVMRTVEQRRPSYRALFSIPGIPRLVASMLLARTAGQMTSTHPRAVRARAVRLADDRGAGDLPLDRPRTAGEPDRR